MHFLPKNGQSKWIHPAVNDAASTPLAFQAGGVKATGTEARHLVAAASWDQRGQALPDAQALLVFLGPKDTVPKKKKEQNPSFVPKLCGFIFEATYHHLNKPPKTCCNYISGTIASHQMLVTQPKPMSPVASNSGPSKRRSKRSCSHSSSIKMLGQWFERTGQCFNTLLY